MKVSVCITVFNEEKSIAGLLKSLLNQTKKPNEIIIIDGGSIDKTVQIIRHRQKKDRRIKLMVERCSRAEGRNLAVEMAKNEIIAMTDAGCTAKKSWLKRISEPFKHREVEIVAGFYKMMGSSPTQKAFSVFLGTHQSDFDINFLPSTRSVAFRKRTWEKLGHFPEDLNDTAEDTVFNYKAVQLDVKFARVKNAIVEWGMPKTFKGGILKMYAYAKGDARSKIWHHPSKGFASHNIKSISIFLRYIFGLLLLLLSFSKPVVLMILLVLAILYSFWSFRKVYLKTNDWQAGLWGIVIQLASDFAVMSGFIMGFFSK